MLGKYCRGELPQPTKGKLKDYIINKRENRKQMRKFSNRRQRSENREMNNPFI